MGNLYEIAKMIIGDLPVGYHFIYILGVLLLLMLVCFILLTPLIVILNLTGRKR